MQKFIRIMAIIATALVALTLLLLIICVPFQRYIAEYFSSSPDIIGLLPIFPTADFLLCSLRLIFVALLIICCGNKRGGIWLEIVVFLSLTVILPVINYVVSTMSTMWYGKFQGYSYLAANTVISRISQFCFVPAGIGYALALVACGMSIVFKFMSKRNADK